MRVVIQFDKAGFWRMYADGPVTVYSIDENTVRDRVYQLDDITVAPERIDALIGDSRIGRLGDMPITEMHIAAALGLADKPPKPKLELVAAQGIEAEGREETR